jgi:hypothetical protein
MIQKIKCIFGKHKYHIIEEYSKDVRKVGCKRCLRQWGMNDRVQAFIPWDAELEEHHKHIRTLPYYQ